MCTLAPFFTASSTSSCTFSGAPGMHIAPQSTIAAPLPGPTRSAAVTSAARL